MNKLNIKITTGSLLKYALPTIISMVFMSVYMMTDGIFVARLINTSALSAVNIVMPLVMVSVALGTMLASGGSAIIAKKLGEGKEQEARQNFSLLTVAVVVCGVVISILGLVFIVPLIRFLGADESIYQYCYDYAFTSLLLFPFGMFAMLFQVFFITAGRAGLGMVITIIGGVVTVALDYICIAILGMGITGAAVSTGVGYAVPGFIGLFYFLLNRKGTLYLVKPKMDKMVLLKSCTNGSSEMVTNLSQSVITILFNNILMRLAGQDGVAAITIILYAQGLINMAFMGYSTGIAPVISYNYGKQDTEQLKKTYNISIKVIGISSVVLFAAAMLCASPLVSVFSPRGTAVYEMAVQGFRLFAASFLFMGFSIFGSSMFTAFSNGKVSAIISFMRALVFVVVCVLLLPQFFGLNGVWMAVPVAELLGLLVTVYYNKKLKTTYQYA